MSGFYRVLIRRTINLVIVLFSILILTVALLGETMDKVLTDNIKQEVTRSITEGEVEFRSVEAQQRYMEDQIELRIRNLGLDEPCYYSQVLLLLPSLLAFT